MIFRRACLSGQPMMVRRYIIAKLDYNVIMRHEMRKTPDTLPPPHNNFAEKMEERELYELCQQLTRQNRHLRREVSDLKKLVASRDNMGVDESLHEDNYREINYDCYKKKALHLLASLKFLHNLYIQRNSLEEREKILDQFMGKLRKGKINHIQQLLTLYEERLKGQEQDGWDIDELEREASEYQNGLLRKHIKKLGNILMESVASLRNGLNTLKVDIVTNNQNISSQIRFYCQKYMQPEQQIKPQAPPAVKSSKKAKKKKVNDENTIHKASWDKIMNQRSKLKERVLQPNVKEKIQQSLLLVQKSSIKPLSNANVLRPSVPKPQSKRKQEITIVDELNHSKNLKSSMTRSHESRGSSIYLNSRKNSVKYCVDMPSNKKSSGYSPKNAHSYYR